MAEKTFKVCRYYQCEIDESGLNKGSGYELLPDTFIIFFCTFDYMGQDLPVCTFKTACLENKNLLLPDGTAKIISSKAAGKEADAELKAFLNLHERQKSQYGPLANGWKKDGGNI